MNHFYSLYGLSVQANDLIPGLAPLKHGPLGAPDIKVRFEEIAPESHFEENAEDFWYASTGKDAHGQAALKIWKASAGDVYRFVYFDGVQFSVNVEAGEIRAHWSVPATKEDVATYLLGPVLGYLLRRRGVVGLHASAVVVEGRAVAFLGPEGTGKSTTAAAMVQTGWAGLSDDVVALREQRDCFFAAPAYPYMCLWPDSARLLFGSPEALRRLTPTWEKRFLPLRPEAGEFAEEAVPLTAIYILAGRRRDSTPPRIERAPPREAVIALVANTYANKLLEPAERAREFVFLGRVAARVPVRKIWVRDNLKSLADEIQSDLRQLSVAAGVKR